MIPNGTKFHNPTNTGGFYAEKDIYYGGVVRLKAFGDCRDIVAGEISPSWLTHALYDFAPGGRNDPDNIAK